MQVKSITLHNIGQFKELTISLTPLTDKAPKVTVFIGNNGSGKTTILKSLVTALSWLPARIRSERGRGLDIPEKVIMNGHSSGMVVLNIENTEQSFTWQISKAQKGRKNQFSTDLKAINQLADIHRTHLTENEQTDLPILAFYPVERSVLDIPLKIREKHSFAQLNGYDNALEIGVDFRRFFEWFREREDIENEENAFLDIEQISNEIDEMNSYIDNSLDTFDKMVSLQKDIEEKERELIKAKNNNELEKIANFSKQLIELTNKFIKAQSDTDSFLTKAESLRKKDTLRKKINYLDIQLKSVKDAVQNFTNFKNIRIRRKPKLRMIVEKDNLEFEVSQLSQGEKSLMALVGDIARRLAMLNPSLENPLNGQGIVIIDEADLHLHPQWQRQLIERLTKTFPNCQFVLSTHSPLVISDSKDIIVYSLENGEIRQVSSQYGQDANTVLLNVMETAIRNEEVTQKLNHLLDLIQDNQLDEAKMKLTALRKDLPENNLELAKAQLLLKKQEIRHEKNSKS
ncbi:ATP-binding protein [Neisseria mucosa]|nr:ATP-binding protein [Neisseria mucosa]